MMNVRKILDTTQSRCVIVTNLHALVMAFTQATSDITDRRNRRAHTIWGGPAESLPDLAETSPA